MFLYISHQCECVRTNTRERARAHTHTHEHTNLCEGVSSCICAKCGCALGCARRVRVSVPVCVTAGVRVFSAIVCMYVC